MKQPCQPKAPSKAQQTATQSESPVDTAQLDWGEDGTPVSRQFGDVYFSRHSGIEETRYVFLEHNELPARLASLAEQPGAVLHVGETGFGTGLNFLCAWQLRDQLAPHCRLQFTSVEKYPLTADSLRQALSHWPELAGYAAQLLARYPVLTPGWHRIDFIEARVQLNLFIGDVLAGLGSQRGSMDAWFLDGFAPAKNPAMWSAPLFAEIARLSRPGTRFSTFTAAAVVREGLQEAGFEVSRVKGFGRKRHMLAGCLPASRRPAKAAVNPTPWFTLPSVTATDRHTIVIGAGLAGCSTAFSLARRNWQVTVLDRQPCPAQEASGNRQGILYTKLSAEPSLKSDVYTAAYLYAIDQLNQLFPQGGETHQAWQACGVLQLAHTVKEQQRQAQFLEHCTLPESLVQAVDADSASRLAGIELGQGGLFFPGGGWASPGVLCQRYLAQPGIRFVGNTSIERLDYEQGQWHLYDAAGEHLASAETLVIANAWEAQRFDLSRFLPLKRIRGQVTHLPASESAALKTVVCGNAYIAPPLHQQFHLGATFNLKSDDPALSAADHRKNIEQVSALVPALAQHEHWAELDPGNLDGRVGFRCTSPDYLPLVGPVPDYEAFLSDYAHLRKDATTRFTQPGRYQPGLYVNTGHGSKGLVTCPLAGELIASMLCGEALPLEARQVNALNPARFLIRDLIRNKIAQS